MKDYGHCPPWHLDSGFPAGMTLQGTPLKVVSAMYWQDSTAVEGVFDLCMNIHARRVKLNVYSLDM
jgi:hypothetical protein